MKRPLRIATFLAPNVRPVYQAVADAVAGALGRNVELVTGESFAQFARGEIDAGFICGLPYVQLARMDPSPVEPIAAPVLAGDRYGGRPVYFSDVIVHRAASVTSLAELRGRSWAYNDRDSHSGYNVTRYSLRRLGVDDRFFGRVVAAGFHQRAIRMVAAGEIDAAAIDSQVLAVELNEHPELAASLRVIASWGPSTIQPLVAARRLREGAKTAIREAVLAMADNPLYHQVLTRGQVERFVSIADADYDDIRQMLAIAESTGYLDHEE